MIPVVKALLMIDLVDSTKLIHAVGDQRSAIVFARTDQGARELFALHRGREIDRTDGFLVLFDRAADAVACSLAYHAGLVALSRELEVPLAARAAVHVAEVVLRHNSESSVLQGAKPIEVEGLAKPVTARVLGVCRGRQTLCTRAAADMAQRAAVDGALPTAIRFKSCGAWRFKGIGDAIELVVVTDGAGPFLPPLRSDKGAPVRNHTARWTGAVAFSAATLVGVSAWRAQKAPAVPIYSERRIASLGQGTAAVSSAALSPDGATVVYVTDEGDTYSVPAAGGTVVRLPIAVDAERVVSIEFFPDGEHLLLATRPEEEGVTTLSFATATLDGIVRRLRYNGDRGRLSQDGAQLAFTLNDHLFVADLPDGPPRPITAVPDPASFAFAWSPDGQWLAG
jgi:hypothetical protein